MENPPLPDEPEFLTVKQAAKHLNISPGCVYRLCITRKLTHHRFGDGRGAIRFRQQDLLDFISRCRVERLAPEPLSREDHRRHEKPSEYVYKHLDLRPRHACGARTRAGTTCKRMTEHDRSAQHQVRPVR